MNLQFLRYTFKSEMSDSQYQGTEFLAKSIIELLPSTPTLVWAYMLATAWHETAATMMPIAERGSQEYFRTNYDITGRRPAYAQRMGNVTPGDGFTYRGRGYVQLTWRANYVKAGKILRLPLEQQPDLAMQPDIAAKIMVYGMVEGWFTGAKITRYITNEKSDLYNARRVINGLDRATLIAEYALQFNKVLEQLP